MVGRLRPISPIEALHTLVLFSPARYYTSDTNTNDTVPNRTNKNTNKRGTHTFRFFPQSTNITSYSQNI